MNDKERRDSLFDELRESTDPYERQAVKYSDVEVIGRDEKTGKDICQTVWVVAHPLERAN
jgi:hypothetical protein